MPSNSLLDLSSARAFADEPAQLRELVVTFEQSLVEQMAVIQTGLASNNALQVAHALHVLKGFMALFTTETLAQAMTDLYQTSREQALSVTGPMFTALVPSLEALLAEVRAWLAL